MTRSLSDSVASPTWLVICPPKNWQHPIPIAHESLEAFVSLATRLKLLYTIDDEQKKLYVGHRESTDLPPGLRFPSGWTASVHPEEQAGPIYKAVDPTAAAPLIRAFPDARLSDHFKLSEFRPAPNTYDFIRIAPGLVEALEEIRARVGEPLHVTSGYRPADYNREVGGVSNSSHVDGLAADFYADGISTANLFENSDSVIGSRGGVGYYPNSGFVHVDLRGYRARWSGS